MYFILQGMLATFIAAPFAIAADFKLDNRELDPKTEAIGTIKTFIASKDAEAFNISVVEAPGSSGPRAGETLVNVGLTAREALNILQGRQRCNPGWGLCTNGSCVAPGATCCGIGACDPGELCCSNNGCVTPGRSCCRDGSSCPPGYGCYISPSRPELGIVCCVDNTCGYRNNPVTTQAPPAPPPAPAPTAVTTRVNYYYYTYEITWSYYFYYWTYSRIIAASVVTSTMTTRTTELSVRATDSADASLSFLSMSKTLELPTPASATFLASIPTKTKYDFTSSRSEPTAETTLRSGGGGGSVSSARSRWANIDHGLFAFLVLGATVGVAAIIL